MQNIGVTLGLASMPAWLETPIAGQVATSLRTMANKVFWSSTLYGCFWVSRTTECNGIAGSVHLCELVVDVGPHSHVAVGVAVSDEVQAVLCATQKHIDSVLGLEKAHLSVIVAANQRDNDDFGFLALEVVNRCQAYSLSQCLFLNSLPCVKLVRLFPFLFTKVQTIEG